MISFSSLLALVPPADEVSISSSNSLGGPLILVLDLVKLLISRLPAALGFFRLSPTSLKCAVPFGSSSRTEMLPPSCSRLKVFE